MSIFKKIQFFLIITSMSYLLVGCTTECPRCKGSGDQTKEYVAKTKCNSCNGSGKKTCNYTYKNNSGWSVSNYKCENGYYKYVSGSGIGTTGNLAGNKCPSCNGRGYSTCSSCNGTGYHERTKTKQVDCSKCDGTGKVSSF